MQPPKNPPHLHVSLMAFCHGALPAKHRFACDLCLTTNLLQCISLPRRPSRRECGRHLLHYGLICLVNELAHGLAVPEQVRMIVANVLHCWALEPDAFRPPPPRCRTAGNAAGA